MGGFLYLIFDLSWRNVFPSDNLSEPCVATSVFDHHAAGKLKGGGGGVEVLILAAISR